MKVEYTLEAEVFSYSLDTEQPDKEIMTSSAWSLSYTHNDHLPKGHTFEIAAISLAQRDNELSEAFVKLR